MNTYHIFVIAVLPENLCENRFFFPVVHAAFLKTCRSEVRKRIEASEYQHQQAVTEARHRR
jgi:hypothetical protein